MVHYNQAAKFWYYTALAEFKTQFTTGYDYSKDNDTIRSVVSDFMTPAYLITSLGMDYIPNKYLSLYVSPVTGRFVFVNDTTLSVKYGLDERKHSKSEFGAYLRAINHFDIVKNINLNSKLELFSAYETFGNIVVNWDLLLTSTQQVCLSKFCYII